MEANDLERRKILWIGGIEDARSISEFHGEIF